MTNLLSAPAFPREAELPNGAAALRALAWLDRGQPQDEIVYDEETSPKQSKEELSLFRPARLRKVKGKT